MIDLESGNKWDKRLRPIGETSWEKEPFSAWWSRHSTEFAHLDPQALEQWVHRHWHYSPFCRLPLHRLRSKKELWSTERILSDVFNDNSREPEHDFKVLANAPTGKAMLATGTWDYPMLILSTPKGFKDRRGNHPGARFRLIEGHLRFRFLNALFHRKEGRPLHEVIILEINQ
ncbi:hypothetical protein JYK02_10800 [Corallococcus macrosporus]|uniref:Uncharacterized protein n=1 Tax=Corallococcus macrosporus TaxID=35 RepID=A0ABS3DAW2_9BACT|nr:hypothetical protein [Corallococcus macrosporus]MBN8227996.1 hypothetical protein [Corallococcus macrosporus]